MTLFSRQNRGKYRILFFIFIFLFFSGCAGPKVALDLLIPPTQNNNPLLNNDLTINTDIAPNINNYEKLDETLKTSLQTAIRSSNIFGPDSSNPYKLDATILVASQSPMSFGNFEGTLKVRYVLFDNNDKQVLTETIYTEAGSDEWFFSGAKRHRRARAVNIAKNVMQFVEILQNKFEKK